jgi:uncharacterized membrane protein YozB (DUF420 family)
MILFGSSAILLSDINLVLQYVTLVLLIAGYVKRKRRKIHGYIMLFVFLITVGTTIGIMAPAIVIAPSFYPVQTNVHVIVGTVAIIFGALFVYRFVTAIRNQKPLTCGTKNVMRIAVVLWIAQVLEGTIMYIMLYL